MASSLLGSFANTSICSASKSCQLLDAEQIDVLAKLPSREEAITLIAAVLQAPISKFATLLNEVPSKLARVLQAVHDKKQASA